MGRRERDSCSMVHPSTHFIYIYMYIHTSWSEEPALNSFEIDPSRGKLYAGRDVARSSPLSFPLKIFELEESRFVS